MSFKFNEFEIKFEKCKTCHEIQNAKKSRAKGTNKHKNKNKNKNTHKQHARILKQKNNNPKSETKNKKGNEFPLLHDIGNNEY